MSKRLSIFAGVAAAALLLFGSLLGGGFFVAMGIVMLGVSIGSRFYDSVNECDW